MNDMLMVFGSKPYQALFRAYRRIEGGETVNDVASDIGVSVCVLKKMLIRMQTDAPQAARADGND